MDKNFYKNLIPVKNASKMRFMAYLDAVLDHGAALGTMMETMIDAFDIDNAAGTQLDTLGVLVGVSRLLSYVPYTGTREMDDDEYRLAIRLRIARNEWDGTNQGIVDILSMMRMNGVSIDYCDNQDCTVTFTLYGGASTRQAEILNSAGLLPVPAGVSYTVEISTGNVTVDFSMDAGISGMEISSPVAMMNEEHYVSDIQEMLVSKLQNKSVEQLQR